MGSFGYDSYAHSHSLSVGNGVIAAVFDGMTDGVAEIQRFAKAALSFVLFHHVSLELNGTENDAFVK